MSGKDYAFRGYVVRLTQKDFDQAYTQFASDLSPQRFMEELVSIDKWMREKQIPDKKWYFIALAMLRKNKEKRMQEA